jgi:circadian clock protein KaiC
VDEEGVSVVLLDSMNGYRYAMPEEDFLTLHLHELFAYLNHQGVATLVVVAQHGFLGDAVEEPLHISYLADSVILLRYFEAFGQIRKAVSMIKKRLGGHERAIRELVLEPGRVEVGEELRDFLGIISGELEYRGERAPLLDRRTEGA